jgi:UDP-N-acetylmuramoyl-L-alanyl-D-glutamate--2,6-diaminopimelate ligase
MRLGELMGEGGAVEIAHLAHDTREVRDGTLFFCVPGFTRDGHELAGEAIERGAAALCVERPLGLGVPEVVVASVRAAMAPAAARFHGDPTARLPVVGITGTNGKTTTAFLLEAGLRAAGHTTGLLGTVETRIGDQVVPSVRTTPEAPDLQGLLAVMRERGVTAVAMEVSSHALALGRVDGVVFDTGVFTNLSQDHLDFHDSMADYEDAKAQLFSARRSRRGVVNVDDPAGRRIADRAEVPVAELGAEGQWHATDVDLRGEGSTFRLRGPGVDVAASVRLPGAFNVTNAAGALVALAVSGVDLDAAVDGVAGLPGVPGRMERVDAGQPFLAVVDYAHTPDAVETLLRSVRAVTTGRVIVVLGCGGDRDRGKRPLMGRAAADGADVAVLTSDNPRSEDPDAILAEMAAGAPDALREVDRRTAIALAVSLAGPGDAVVVAGKGHETGQEVAGVVTPFDDRLVLREVLSA